MFGLSYNEKNKQKNKSSQYFIIFRPTAVDLFYTTSWTVDFASMFDFVGRTDGSFSVYVSASKA